MIQISVKSKSTGIARQAATFWAVCVLTILVSSLAGFAGTADETHLVNPTHVAVPKPTPPNKPLDHEAASALVEELKASLEDAIEDEAVISSIGGKWDAKSLAGKTRSQILAALFADVKSVVKDQKTLDKIWASWKSEDEETEPEVRPTKPDLPPMNPETPTIKPEPTQIPTDTRLSNPDTAQQTDDMIEVEPPPLSGDEMKAVMDWIGVKVGAERLPFCWRASYGNTAGEPYTCKPGLERIGLLCYPTCKPGYHKSTANLCTTDCPAGFSDIGAFCQKPAPYGRGGGYEMAIRCLPNKSGGRFCAPDPNARAANCEKDHGKGNCEQWGLLFYPKCKPNYHAVGCCVCSPDCPDGWADTGTGCTKPVYGIGAGEGLDLGKCRAGFDKDPAGALCYPTCKKEFHMVGPVCWQNCPSQQSFDCGAGCTTNQGECAKNVFDQVFSPIMAAITLATWGRTSAIAGAAKAAKIATTASRLTKAFDAVKGILAVAKGAVEKAVGGAENLAKLQQVAKIGGRLYKAGSAIGREVDHFTKEYADNFADETSPEIAAEIDKRFGPVGAREVKRAWATNILFVKLDAEGFATAKNALALVSAADPTGIVGVAEAFMHPICKSDTPFPTVHPLYNR